MRATITRLGARSKLGLGPDEALYIECAEDFDKLGPNDSVANQVKNSPGDISLGAEEVRSAIANYWRLWQDNPGSPPPTLRFLVKGGITPRCSIALSATTCPMGRIYLGL